MPKLPAKNKILFVHSTKRWRKNSTVLRVDACDVLYIGVSTNTRTQHQPKNRITTLCLRINNWTSNDGCGVACWCREVDRGGDVFHSRLRLTNKGRVTFLWLQYNKYPTVCVLFWPTSQRGWAGSWHVIYSPAGRGRRQLASTSTATQLIFAPSTPCRCMRMAVLSQESASPATNGSALA